MLHHSTFLILPYEYWGRNHITTPLPQSYVQWAISEIVMFLTWNNSKLGTYLYCGEHQRYHDTIIIELDVMDISKTWIRKSGFSYLHIIDHIASLTAHTWRYSLSPINILKATLNHRAHSNLVYKRADKKYLKSVHLFRRSPVAYIRIIDI